jgi:hypothetical protein
MSPLCDVKVEKEEMIKKREKAIEEMYKTMEKIVKIAFSSKQVNEQSLEGIFGSRETRIWSKSCWRNLID